jgi:hypothetical protein
MKTKKQMKNLHHGVRPFKERLGVTRRKKRLSYQNSVFSVVKFLLLILTLAIISCGGDTTHTHTWGAWKSNADGHWQECTAGDGAKTAEGPHTGNPCTLCGYETPHEPQPTTITQDEGLAFNGTVKISTTDQYRNADWDEVVANIIVALNRGYNKYDGGDALENALNKNNFNVALHANKNAEIIVSASANKKIEVLSTDYTKMYLKASVIDGTLDLCLAVKAMMDTSGGYELANTQPAKGGVFLANVPDTGIA